MKSLKSIRVLVLKYQRISSLFFLVFAAFAQPAQATDAPTPCSALLQQVEHEAWYSRKSEEALKVSSLFKLKHPSQREWMTVLISRELSRLKSDSSEYQQIIHQARQALQFVTLSPRQEMAIYLAASVDIFPNGVYDKSEIFDDNMRFTPAMIFKANILLVGGIEPEKILPLIPVIVRR